jgi:hypothetical protein
MTKREAYEFVQNTFDDDNVDDDRLRAAFVAIFGRQPDADETVDMWSHICSATPHCSCSTRREHEQGGCGTKISIWDDVTGVECAINANGE